MTVEIVAAVVSTASGLVAIWVFVGDIIDQRRRASATASKNDTDDEPT